MLISLAALGLALLARFGTVLITSRGIYDPAVRLKHDVVGAPGIRAGDVLIMWRTEARHDRAAACGRNLAAWPQSR